MTKKDVINKTIEYVRSILENESSGHDWWHTYRVWKNALSISEKEGGDLFVIQLAALLHEIDDWKFIDKGENRKYHEWLNSLDIDENIISQVHGIIENLSFKGKNNEKETETKEGLIVQDADRLDSIGAIGIARGFMFAGNKNLPMHDPDIKYIENITEEQYTNLKRPTYTQINHFYEKLLLLKDLMNTKTAKELAKDRHEYMKNFLNRFFKEWEGKV